MKINVTIKNYAGMSIKEIENEHKLECEKLLKLINENADVNLINSQKKQVDLVYQQLGVKLKKVSKLKG